MSSWQDIGADSNWHYVACINDGRKLSTILDKSIEVVSNNIGFDINYYSRNSQFQLGQANVYVPG